MFDVGRVMIFGTDSALAFRSAQLQHRATVFSFGLLLLAAACCTRAQADGGSPRAEITTANWDKGGPLSHWTYTHLSEVFPTALVRRGGAVRELPQKLRPEIGALVVDDDDPTATLDRFVANGAVDGIIVLQHGVIVYEKYPGVGVNDPHLLFSVSKALVATTLALLEDEGQIDLAKPVEAYLPELKPSAWAGTPLRDVADMRSGMEGEEQGNDAYRNPAQNAFQLEATLGWQLRTAAGLNEATRHGDLLGFLASIKRVHPAGSARAYNSSNTALIGEVIARVTHQSLADAISQRIWSRIGAEHDALLAENERGYPVAHAGVAATLRDLARFGLLFTKPRAGDPHAVLPERILQRMFQARGAAPDDHGLLPQTYQWDLLSAQGELAKGGWAGQLLYVNREKDVVVAWLGTNKTGDPPLEALPCRMIAKALD